MIDIHSHMLPGVDDGSPSLAVTKNILARYVEEGVDKVICTPHQNSALLRPALLKERFAELQGNVAEFPVGLYLGAELYYCENIVDLLASGRFLTLAGTKYVLVEFSTRHEMVYIPDAVYELSVAGYVPIVAHIERYPYFPLKQWAEVRENGGLIQLNASCFAKKENLGLAKKALKGGLVDFIASDAHGDVHRRVDFSAAKSFVNKKFPKYSDALFGRQNALGL